MTSFYMTSLQVDLNEAILGLTYEESSSEFQKVGGIKTWKEFTIGVQELVRLLFNNKTINPGLVL